MSSLFRTNASPAESPVAHTDDRSKEGQRTNAFRSGQGQLHALPILSVGLFFGLLLFLLACENKSKAMNANPDTTANKPQVAPQEPPLALIPIPNDITIKGYFPFMDKLIQQYDTLKAYHLTEHLLVHANPWIIDTLANTDYYYQMALGNFVYDQRNMIVLKRGDTLRVPGQATAQYLQEKLQKTYLDINIPAFQLRIMEGDSVLHTCPIRVGKDQKKFLEMAGGVVNLHTRTGTGEIVRINRNPAFYDPVTGKQFKFTKRDDQKTTYMPQIPWLEPSINGVRYGQMIHPTTNPRSLGKTSSNGCMGTKESDAWRIYYHAPLGTKVVIRYDLMEINSQGDTLHYKDIYHYHRSGKTASMVPEGIWPKELPHVCLCDSLF